MCRLRSRVLFVLMLALLFFVPGWMAAGDPLPGLIAAEAAKAECDAGPGLEGAVRTPLADLAAMDPVPADAAVDDALLWRLHGLLAHLPGFVDVHYVLEGEPRLIAYFRDVVPATLPDLGVPYPVTAEVLPELGKSTADEGADPPLIPAACPGLRPGASMGGCTWAWVLSDAQGRTYLTTAGHCVGGAGSRVGSVGTVVYALNGGVGRDFAVVLVDAEDVANVRPDMCHWGGPTAETGAGSSLLRQYGWGIGFGTNPFTRPRSGVLYGIGTASFTYIGPQVAGDSGSPVRYDSGPALGVHTHGAVSLVLTSAPGIKYGTRLVHGLGLAEAATGLDFSLVTAPVA